MSAQRWVLCVAAALVLIAAWGSWGIAAEGEEPPLVAIVYGEYSGRDLPRGERRNARRYLETVRGALDAVGVEYTVLNDTEVEADGLLPYQVAIFPYNYDVPEAEQEAIERYVVGGGRIMFCYAIPERVATLLGFRVKERREGDFRTLRLDQERLQGAPESVAQRSWNIRPVEPAEADVEVVGEWLDAEGKPLGEPGLIVSPRGAYLTHVLTRGDATNKGRMLLALLSRFAPELWERTAQRAIARSAQAAEDLSTKIAREREDAVSRRRGVELVARSGPEVAEARRLAGEERWAEAIEAALRATGEARRGYIASAPERRDEFRGVWLHDAYGVPGWGWERTARELRDHGFNAIIVNMLWAGLAHYESEVLPVSPQVEEQGDQIAEALRWCREYGIELHVWKVNYNLSTAPDDFVARLRAEGRLQQHRDGSEAAWLCPSDPRNLALERDSMLEVARKYDVDGIHFDYIRYPHSEVCFCDGCRQRFEEAAGVKVEKWPEGVLEEPLVERFNQWRREQITNLVQAVAAEARRIRPGVMVSAAVFGWPGALQWVHQEWPRWVGEGLLDFVCPMNYTADAEELEQTVSREVQVVEGQIPLYIGIGAFIIPETYQVVDQIERARRLGADGFVCFSYEHLGSAPERMADLHSSLLAHATRPPHVAPRVQFTLPEGVEGVSGLTYAAGSPIHVEASLTTEGNYAHPILWAAGSLYVETTEGRMLQRLGRMRTDQPGPLAAALELPQGRYRLAMRGTARFDSGPARDFTVRSRPFSVLAAGDGGIAGPPAAAGAGEE